MAEPAEVENPKPPPTKKPRTQATSILPGSRHSKELAELPRVRGFSILRKVHTDERASLSHSTMVGLMSLKFNNVACCFDAVFLMNF